MFSHSQLLDWSFDPLEALARWPADKPVVMLHSGRHDARWANKTILAEPAGHYRFDLAGPLTSNAHPQGQSQLVGACASQMAKDWNWHHEPLADVRQVLSFDPTSLWIGYLSYDIARHIERLPATATQDRHWPVVELAYCPGYLVYDNAQRQWRACGCYQKGWSSPTQSDKPCLPDLAARHAQYADYQTGMPASVLTESAYESAVQQVLDFIAAGDVFQVNLAQRLTCHFKGPYPLAQRNVYRQLAAASPAWYGAYLELADQRVIASTSPELFLDVNAAGQIITRPIKGTRPASVSADQLKHSLKDQAELNMIVDLMRNDLGRVCQFGSVKVADPRTIESHPTVHHGVATITGQLCPDKDIVDLLQATLPGGSVTGAPKIRAMQIIDQLEPVTRGPYCGAIGMLGQQHACLNIAIRTMLIHAKQNMLDFSVGAGIVADSNPSAEYSETLDKAAALLTALRCQSMMP